MMLSLYKIAVKLIVGTEDNKMSHFYKLQNGLETIIIIIIIIITSSFGL